MEEENRETRSCSGGTRAMRMVLCMGAAFHTRREARFSYAHTHSSIPLSGYLRAQRARILANLARLGEEGVTRYAYSAACLLALDGWGMPPTFPARTSFTRGCVDPLGAREESLHRSLLHNGLALHASACHLLGCHGRPQHPTGAVAGCSELGMVQ